ncbi:hypothetical protein INR49_016320 [Caranx melampygus]|nr:hypothetical protein INR49_016320 [Caranx melampygus]
MFSPPLHRSSHGGWHQGLDTSLILLLPFSGEAAEAIAGKGSPDAVELVPRSCTGKRSNSRVKGHRAFCMETLFTHSVEKNNCMRGTEEEEEEEEESEDEDKEEENSESSALMQQKLIWAPFFFYRTDKEVYHYVGQEIVIKEGLDSYAGMIWPAALALSSYLDTHREQLNLVDKAVLEIGAGTGLVSVVAALLGAWVTASDLPEFLSNLRYNLSRNTTGRCRHAPQVAALPWSFDLEQTYPTSIYRYDYILASDVVYHHDCLDELLATMKHFCRAGTSVIWANKVRMESDLTFMENFKKTFHTSLLSEDGDMKIFMATCREEEEEEEERGGEGDEIQKKLAEEEEPEDERGGDEEESDGHESDEEEETLDDEEEEEDSNCSNKAASEEETTGKPSLVQTAIQQGRIPAWVPSIHSGFGKDIYHYVGHDIVIHESIDSYGAVMWPAALALCSFLDNNRNVVNLQGKEVLELGAGTGLVTIVASLLGASVTSTDLPEVLSNLRANVMRNTRGRCRQMPEVEVLSWGFNLERTHPTCIYRYDYILAADVVYHHDFLPELLATMKHFCRRGTTVIWANKVRMESDLTFMENFKKTFHTSLLSEDGDMKIFMGTFRQPEI